MSGTALVLSMWFASPSSLQAQMFNGSEKLATLPSTFGALVYPVETRPQTIRINVANPDRAMVHTMIMNEKGSVVYDGYDNKATRREYYNVSTLPDGNYVVTLSTKRDRIDRAFTIGLAKEGYITMGDRPMPVTGEIKTRQQLVVNE